jgi:3'(2'), 5'-bisphosphate nucleotidase
MKHLLALAVKASLEAGDAILDIYNGDRASEVVLQKENDTPLTIADREAHTVISRHLAYAAYPVLSEEGRDIPYAERSAWEHFWMVDPLDGTKEFLKRNGQFTVNIALIRRNEPILGVIYQPTEDVLYFAAEGVGAYKCTEAKSRWDGQLAQLIEASVRLPIPQQRDTYVIVASRSHLSEETQQFIDRLKQQHSNVETTSIGSSLKICLVAEGSADIYPRFAPTMEWDTAAGDAIARCAGKQVLHSQSGLPLPYNKPNLLNDWFIVREKAL